MKETTKLWLKEVLEESDSVPHTCFNSINEILNVLEETCHNFKSPPQSKMPMLNVHLYSSALYHIIDGAVTETKMRITNVAQCEASDDWDKKRTILCCTLCKQNLKYSKAYINMDPWSAHAQVHIPRWFKRDATVILCPHHAQSSWIPQSPDNWTVVNKWMT